MKIGVFTVSMPEYSPREAIKILKELGYDGIEWRVGKVSDKKTEDVPYEDRYWKANACTLDIEKLGEEAEEIKEMCRKNGIAILSLTTYLESHEREEIEKVLKSAVAMDCRQVRVFTPGYDGSENYNKIFNKTREDIKELEKLAQKYEVKIVFEIHMDNLLASPSAAYRMLSGLDSRYIGVIYDPGNMVFEGFENYKKSFELLGGYIAHIHIKNGMLEPCEEDKDGVLRWKRTWTPITKGSADLKELFQVMKEMGYGGNISVEDFSNQEATYEKLRYNLKYLKKWSAAEEV